MAKAAAKKPGKKTSKKTTKKSAAKKKAAGKSKATAKKSTSKKAAVKKSAAKKRAAKRNAPANRAADSQSPPLEMSSSRQFVSWLYENNLSFAFSTYQAGKVFFIGLQPNGRLSIFERTFNRCMGLYNNGDGALYMSSLYQLWRFENILKKGQIHDNFDALYLPVNGHTTGDVDVHDIAQLADGRPIFVNTLFSCLATVDERHSFVPVWWPKFISKIAAEDRCHLNGLAMEDGRPRYVSAVADTDVPNGWRDRRENGGCLIDVDSGEIMTHGLSMPHSPRLYNHKLYVLNSGTGEFGEINRETGEFNPIAFCPGYLRGLAFHKWYALVGLSRPRHKTFTGLPLDQALSDHKADSQCAVYVIDLRTGDIVHWLRIDGLIQELYDVVALPDIRRPMAVGFVADDIRRTLNVAEPAPL